MLNIMHQIRYIDKIIIIMKNKERKIEETVKLLRSMIDSGSPPEHILMKAEIIEGDSVKKINNI